MANTAALVLFTAFVFTGPASALAQRADTLSLPEGKGKELVATRCAGCHDLNTAVSRRATTNEWRDTIASMVERGAQVTAADVPVIAAYLAEHYGPQAPAPSAASATALPDGPGKDLLAAKCFQCHGQTMWNDLRQDRRAWQGVLYRMVGRRALWTEEEINAMADYLARVRGVGVAR
jgi:mono/diheme cytochrome c family protein